MLLRLACVGMSNALALPRLLPMSERAKDIEILALQHRITVLERQLGTSRPLFEAADRAFLAALLHRFPMERLRRLRLLVRPETVMRWHRDLVARQHAVRSRPGRPGRPRTVHSVRALEKPLSEKEIIEIAKNLGDVAQRLQSAEPTAKAALYEALGITVSYENATRTATVRSRPSHAYRWSECPRGDLNPHAR
ncbi:hypothetical protein [Streptomyces sp. NPDC047130]|uniref:hypothetical protein n=1 Tax=Streptomyces sp. NPDC047130 TaxID=3155261 RepID=UPI0033E1207A